VVGAVDDVRPALASAAIVVAPVRFGTGMRGKVLEALAMGRPVVTTALGAEGLGAEAGRDLLVADDAPAFAAAIRRLLDDPSLAAAVGAAGRALVVRRFDWDVVAREHDAIYEAALSAPTPPRPALDRAPALRNTVGRLGRLPAIATGALLVGARATAWHLARPRRA
jgi:hypothetical protein